MKLLILSDTHGNFPLAWQAVVEAGPVDRIIHLGDEIEDARMIERVIGRPIIKVAGNCDLGSDECRDQNVICYGNKLFITHGDRYGVKAGLAKLHRKGAAEGADIVLYGHTHIAAVEEREGILLINPGSLSCKCTAPSYAVLTITERDVEAEIIPVEA